MDDELSIPERLRAETAIAHHDAESRQFVTDLLEGRSSLDAYTIFLAQLALVYRELEAPRRANIDDPEFLSDRRLHRLGAIESDLAALGAYDWRDQIPVLHATREYAARIAETRGDSASFTAHHYTRYLGDLSGGQVIATMLERHYGAPAEQLSFYEFGALGPLVPYKRQYREQLATLPWNESKVGRLVGEAKVAFECNARLFEELAQPATAVR